MKRTLICTLVCFAAVAPLSFAQAPQPGTDTQPPAPLTRPHRAEAAGRHQRNPHRQALMLSRRLSLTPDQTAKLEPILADRQQRMAALRANTSLTPEDREQQFRSLRRQERAQLASVLTPDQQQQLKAMRHGRRGEDHLSVEPQPASTH